MSNVIEIAGDIGDEFLPDIGRKVFENLEISYLSSILNPIESAPTFRLKQHFFLYGPKGWFKDTMVNTFFNKCTTNNYFVKDMSYCSLESAFGSLGIGGDKLYPPVFWGYNMAVITELLGFMSKQDLRAQIGLMNKILEGNIVSRDLVKYGNASEELVDEYFNGKNGLTFDGRALKYQPSTCFTICSHLLDAETLKLITDNALVDRFKDYRMKITDTLSKDILKDPIKRWNFEDMNALKELNGDWLETLKVKQIEFPESYKEISEKALDLAQKEASSSQESIDEIYGIRASGNLVREVIVRELVGSPLGNIDIGDFVKHKFEMYQVEALDTYDMKSNKARDLKDKIEKLLKIGNKPTKEILDELQGDYSTRTIYKVLNLCFKQVDYGVWGLKEKN